MAATSPAALIHLDDFLDSGDFPDNLAELAEPLAAKLGLRRPVDELGVVCADVPALVRKLEAKYPGMGPFFMGEGSPTEFEEDGKLVPYKSRVAFGYYRGLLIELAEPGQGSDLFQRAYDPSHATIHHLGFFARDDQLNRQQNGEKLGFRELMKQAGFVPHVRALVGVLGFFGRVTIFNTPQATRGVDIEFLDFRFFSRNGLKVSLPAWLVSLTARIQRLFGHPVLELPPSS